MTLIVLGYGGVLFPSSVCVPPMSFIMPSGFMQNPLVRDYMLPPLAEVQRPWVHPEAYIRPSAPFPYANSWGLAYTLLTPVMLACLLRLAFHLAARCVAHRYGSFYCSGNWD